MCGDIPIEQKTVCILGDILYVSGNGIRKVQDVDSCATDNNSCFTLSNVIRHSRQMLVFAYPIASYSEEVDVLLEKGIISILETRQERKNKTGMDEFLYAFNMESEEVRDLCKEAVKQKQCTPIL
jgi:hypothetical protein